IATYPLSLHGRSSDLIPETDKICACGRRKTPIGEAVTEKLEYVPASLRVIETARLKYACARCHEGVVEALAPPQALEKSLAGERSEEHTSELQSLAYL